MNGPCFSACIHGSVLRRPDAEHTFVNKLVARERDSHDDDDHQRSDLVRCGIRDRRRSGEGCREWARRRNAWRDDEDWVLEAAERRERRDRGGCENDERSGERPRSCSPRRRSRSPAAQNYRDLDRTLTMPSVPWAPSAHSLANGRCCRPMCSIMQDQRPVPAAVTRRLAISSTCSARIGFAMRALRCRLFGVCSATSAAPISHATRSIHWS